MHIYMSLVYKDTYLTLISISLECISTIKSVISVCILL